MRLWPLTIPIAMAFACGGATSSEPRAADPAQPTAVASAVTSPLAVAAPQAGDAPEISRSAGAPGGVVLLWPRIVADRGATDADNRQIAARIQRRLAALIGRALPGRTVDVRPEPERVCPRAGCAALAVGSVLSRSGAGCAVAAVVSDPGPSAARVVPWAGNVSLRYSTVPFRQPPEQAMSVDDYQSCGALEGDLSAHERDVEAALRKGGGG